MIFHKFSHGAVSYTLNGENVNVMLEYKLQHAGKLLYIYAKSNGSDQPAYRSSLVGSFAVCMQYVYTQKNIFSNKTEAVNRLHRLKDWCLPWLFKCFHRKANFPLDTIQRNGTERANKFINTFYTRHVPLWPSC